MYCNLWINSSLVLFNKKWISFSNINPVEKVFSSRFNIILFSPFGKIVWSSAPGIKTPLKHKMVTLVPQ